jgi:nonribosomal peptide synthetase protein BlmIV
MFKSGPSNLRSAAKEESFRVSHLQESIWLKEQRAPDEAVYNSPIAVHINGVLEEDRLLAAVNSVIETNDSLRACFVERDGMLWQFAGAYVPVPLLVEDLSMFPAPERWRRLYAAIKKHVSKPFDLRRGPLLRCAYFALSANESVLVLTVHHIVSDGWSQGVLVSELVSRYLGSAAQASSKLQFFEYAHARRIELEANPSVFEASRTYWHRFIEGQHCAALPCDRSRAMVESGGGRKQFFALAQHSSLELRALCSSAGVSPFTVFLAVLGLLLKQGEAGSGSWCLPVTVGYRDDARWFDVIGCFVDHVLVKPHADPGLPFLSYLQQVSSAWQDAFAHRDYPFDQLRMEAAKKGQLLDASVVFVYQNGAAVSRIDSVEFTPLTLPEAPAKFDLTVMVAEQSNAFSLSLEYDSTLYDEATVKSLGTRFIHLCEQLISAPGQPVDSVMCNAGLLSQSSVIEGERRQWPQQTVAQLFESTARRCVDEDAIRSGSTVVSFGQLQERVEGVAAKLRSLKAHSLRVGVHLDRSIDLVVSLLAILSEGHCYVPLPPSSPDARLELQIADCAPALIITDAQGLERLRTLSSDCAAFDIHLAEPGEPRAVPTAQRQARAAPAYLIYTSGSTGQPKGAYGLVESVLNRLHWQWSNYPYEPGDRVVLRSPPMFVDSIIEMLAPILGGACAVVAPDDAVRDPRQFWALLVRERITHLTVVPTYLESLLDTHEPGLQPVLKRVHCSGESLSRSVSQAFRDVFPSVPLLNIYGSTEVTADATCHLVDEAEPLIGRPIANTALAIIDARGNVVPRGVAGEIVIWGVPVGGGYHNAPELTADRYWPALQDGRMFRTGDLGRVDESGGCHYLGRSDMQVKVRGMRTSLLEIEEAIGTCPGVRDIAVIVDEQDGRRLTAFYSAHAKLSKSQLLEHARSLLPAHAIPGRWVLVSAIARTDSGKLLRDGKALHALALPVEDKTLGHASLTVLEREVLGVWIQVLGDTAVSIDDHFEQVGGHSLMAIRLVDTLNLQFGCSVRLADFFAAPTVRGTVLQISKQVESGRIVTRTPLSAYVQSRHEPFPLLLMQQAYRIGHDVNDKAQMSTICAFSMDYDTLSLPAFTQALNRAIRRHDMLRAVLVGEDAQRILAEVPHYSIETWDLSRLAGQALATELEHRRDSFSRLRFEPGRWPSFRVAAGWLGGNRYRLFFAFDMLFIDLFSARLLMRELELIYRQEDVVLPQVAISFRDYVLATQSARQGAEFDRAKAYWLARIDQLGKTPQLPIARNRPADEGLLRFKRRGMRMSRDQWQALQVKAAAAGVSVTSVLLGAYASTLETWSGNEAFSLILTLFDRQLLHADIDKLVGDFTSSLVFNCEPTGDEVAADTFIRMQLQLREVLENRTFCGVQVQRELTRRNGGERIAMPVVFTSALGLPEADAHQSSLLSGRLIDSVTQTSNVWIDCQIEEADGGLVVNWDAIDDMFQPAVVEAMFAHYQCLLTALATRDDSWTVSLRTTSMPACDCRLEDNPIANGTLPEQVLKTARTHPDQVALIAAGRELTYAQLLDLALRLLGGLEARGIHPGERVGLLLDKGWEAVVAMLAVSLGGCAYVPIDPTWPPARRDAVMSAAKLAVLLVHSHSDVDDATCCPALVLDDSAFAHAPCVQPVGARPDDVAYIMFTSGTTGTPKGVVIEHGAVVNTIDSINQLFDLTARDRILCVSSLCFDLSVFDIWGPLFTGGACVMLTSEETARPWRWPEIIRKHHVSVWNSVPALMELMVDASAGRAEALASLRLAMLSGDWLPLTVYERLKQVAPGAKLISLGGATEASIWSIYFPVESIDPNWISIPYGRALPGQRMYVLDDLLQPCPVWATGEIYIGGAGLARGYWESPQKTAAQFIDHPRTGERLYRTGDMGCYLPDGDIRFIGRRDGQIKLNGLRIELGEVESVLQAHPLVKNAVSTVTGGRQLNAHVVLAPGSDEMSGAQIRRLLLDHVKAHLPGYMVPTALQILAALPMGANGKVDRAALRDEVVCEAGTLRDRGSSDVIVEPVVAELWQVMLGVMHPQKQDNFFTNGGDSLVATRFVAKLNSIFSLDLTARAIYDYPNLQALAEYVESCRDARGGTVAPLPMAVAADSAQQFLPFPLTDIQRSYHVGRRDDMTLGAVAAHSYIEIDYRGLDLDRFEGAVNSIVERHGMLRCVFRDGGEQRVLERVPRYVIAVDDVRSQPAEQQTQQLAATRRRLSLAAYDPTQWPLFSIAASRHADNVVRVHISLDIIIADAWSTNLIARDLLAFYREDAGSLPALNFAFRDYVNYMATFRHSPHYSRMRNYWQERLETLPSPPALPINHAADESTAARFTRYTQVIDQERWTRLKMRSLECGATPSSMLLTVFGRVLRLASANASFVINVTHFNRPPIHPDINDIVGDFASTFLLEYRCNDSEPLNKAIGALCRQILSDLDNSQYSGVQVLQDLSRHRGRVALAPVVFTSALVLPVNSGASLALDDVQGEVVHALTQTPQVWLDHQVYQEHGNLLLAWDIRDDVFDAQLIQALFALYVAALERLGDDPNAWGAPQLEAPAQLLSACSDHLARVRAVQDPVDAVVAHLDAHPHVIEAWKQTADRGIAPAAAVRLAVPVLERWARSSADALASSLSWFDRLEHMRQRMVGAKDVNGDWLVPDPDASSRSAILARRSYRAFWGAALEPVFLEHWFEAAHMPCGTPLHTRPIDLADVLAWIGSLAALDVPSMPLPKFPYPSAGSCYAVHAYLGVPDGYGLSAGWYRLDPVARSLKDCGKDVIGRSIPNDGVYLVLAADIERIATHYADKAMAFAELEAGTMSAVIDQAARERGLCMRGGALDVLPAVPGMTPLAAFELCAGRDSQPRPQLPSLAVRACVYRRQGADLQVFAYEAGSRFTEQQLCGPHPLLDGFVHSGTELLIELYVDCPSDDAAVKRAARLAIGAFSQRLMTHAPQRNLGMCMLGFNPNGLAALQGSRVRCAVLAGPLDVRQQSIMQGDLRGERELASMLLSEYAAARVGCAPVSVVIDTAEPRAVEALNDGLSVPEPDEPADLVEAAVRAIWCDVLRVSQVSGESNFFRIGGTSIDALGILGRLYDLYFIELRLHDVLAEPTVNGMTRLVRSNSRWVGTIKEVHAMLMASTDSTVPFV